MSRHPQKAMFVSNAMLCTGAALRLWNVYPRLGVISIRKT